MIGEELQKALPSLTDAQLADLLAVVLAARNYADEDDPAPEPDPYFAHGMEQLYRAILNTRTRMRSGGDLTRT